jgi:hypothetical protein
MKKQLLNEINEMKYLFGYKRGVVISEQPVNPPTPAPSTPPSPAPATTNTTPAPATPPSSSSTQNTDDADYSKIVKYYSGNTDANWTFVSAGTMDLSGIIYDYFRVNTKDTATNGNDCHMNIYDDKDVVKNYCKKARKVRGNLSWDGAKPTFTWERNITKSSPGYVSDTDVDFSAVTDDNKIMGLGAKGSLVKKVQNFLASNGYTGETFTNDIQACATDENSCDGNYGTKTKKMVKKFQEDAEIKPDGIFGGQTYAAMFE